MDEADLGLPWVMTSGECLGSCFSRLLQKQLSGSLGLTLSTCKMDPLPSPGLGPGTSYSGL